MASRREEFDRVSIYFDMSNLYFAAKDMGIRIDYLLAASFMSPVWKAEIPARSRNNGSIGVATNSCL